MKALPAIDRLALISKFRLGVSMVVLGLLYWFLLAVLEREAGKAEEQAANLVFNQLSAALMIRGAEAMLSRTETLEGLVGANPFEWLEHSWHNYAGVCRQWPEPRQWCFLQREQKETVSGAKGWLIYNPEQPITLKGQQTQPGQLVVWQVATDFADRNSNGRRDAGERSYGLKLAETVLTRHETAGLEAVN
ncbi:hypothetical protein [Marinobacter sp. F4216]|uniref:hypothetical protein n=1 Tax=Marinobacter sp. F4216 TaxID=2874281 RepID=UPI001CBFAA78|nr:hypothetical protein [Marinobacter sp. F4216]MBZ2170198.1 hypothetical protein [Marinobacter sp. F4216]